MLYYIREVMATHVTRYSGTRIVGANCTACTKLTAADKQALHRIAVQRGVSDYELARQILLEYIDTMTSA